MPRERRRVWYSGHVQGVGFRYRALRVAGGYDVVGYVMNLPDGRVELVAEGEAATLDTFLEAVRNEMADKIRQTTVVPDSSSDPVFRDFSIRHATH